MVDYGGGEPRSASPTDDVVHRNQDLSGVLLDAVIPTRATSPARSHNRDQHPPAIGFPIAFQHTLDREHVTKLALENRLLVRMFVVTSYTKEPLFE